MKSYEHETVVTFDCDDTLFMWNENSSEKITMESPYIKGKVYKVSPHKAHIKVLMDSFARGFLVIVWSAGGAKWAKTIVKALGLTKYVHITMAKPIKYIDDKENIDDILGTRLYIPYKEDTKYE